MRRRVLAVAGLSVLPVLTLLSSCGSDDSFTAYCDVVRAQQQSIGQAASVGGRAGLLAALPSFEQLQQKSPRDIAGDWGIIVSRLQNLQQAFDDAGVDPRSYDGKHPPAGVTPDQQAAIDAGLQGLVTAQVNTALTRVQQEARDVCQTPLSLS